MQTQQVSTHTILTRDFILCFLGQFAFTFVAHTFIPTLPVYLVRSGSNEIEIGFLIGALGVSSLVLRPFVGSALLRIAEKKFLIGGAFLYTLTSLGYLLAISWRSLSGLFPGESPSGDGPCLLSNGLGDIDCQYHPGGLAGTESQLLLSGRQYGHGLGPDLRNDAD